MGGCIFVKSTRYVGSCFSFAIPVVLPTPASACSESVEDVVFLSSHLGGSEAAVAEEKSPSSALPSRPPLAQAVDAVVDAVEMRRGVELAWTGGKKERRGLVLVVEDDEMSFTVLSTFLHRLGFDCVWASTGGQALELLCGYTNDAATGAPTQPVTAALDDEASDGSRKKCTLLRPCCVLMDLGLPDTDGMEVTRKIRLWEQLQGMRQRHLMLPIVLTLLL
jgi:CheY-like chemotaxis protein